MHLRDQARGRRLGRHAALVVALTIALLGVAAPAYAGEKPVSPKPPPNPGAIGVAAASCYGDGSDGVSCNGKDPQSAGCSSGARTLEDGTTSNGFFFELRYSPTCYAAWTRYSSNNGSLGTVYIRGQYHTYSKAAAGYPGESGWTRMIAFNEIVRSCVLFYHTYFPGEGEWVENCTPSR